MADDCIFCKIAKGEIPAHKLWDDDDLLCFLDINPVTKGHCLIIPKEHYSYLTDVPADLAQTMMLKVQETAKTVVEKLSAEMFNVFVVGEDVAHAHIHVVPRYANDKAIDIKHTDDPDAKEFETILTLLKE